jgi:hypothetical protein
LTRESSIKEQSMAEKTGPFKFNYHAGDVGHSVVFGQTGSSKAVPAALAKLWGAIHPCGDGSVAQADGDNQGE